MWARQRPCAMLAPTSARYTLQRALTLLGHFYNFFIYLFIDICMTYYLSDQSEVPHLLHGHDNWQLLAGRGARATGA